MQLPKKGLTALFFLNNKQIKFKNKYKETLEKKHIKRRFKFGNFNTKNIISSLEENLQRKTQEN